MSSRTATARKRLEQPHRIKASKGLFSRSKSSPAPPPPPVPPSPTRPVHSSQSHSSQQHPSNTPRSHIGVDLNAQPPPSVSGRQHLSVRGNIPSSHSGTSSQHWDGNVEPPSFQPQTIPISTPAGPSYVEVSYQPPPPPVNVPGSSTRLPSSKAAYDIHPVFMPPTYPPPSPRVAGTLFVPPKADTPNRARHQSLISEPPDYSPTGSPTTASSRPTLAISTNYQPSPPATPRFDPRRQGWINSPGNLSPIDSQTDGDKRPWYRNALSKLSSSNLAASANGPPTGLRTPPSSNSHSAPSEASQENPLSPVTKPERTEFVFPGGRSNRRPKVSSKTKNKLVEKRLKEDLSGLVPRSPASDTSSIRRGHPGPSPLGSVIDLRPTSSALSSALPKQPPTLLSGNAERDEARSAFSDDEDVPSKSAPAKSQADPPPFVFPSSRSRAAPKKPPMRTKRSRKFSSATDDSNPGERPTFMKKLISKKKKSTTSGSSSSPSVYTKDVERPSSPGAGPSSKPLHALHGPPNPSGVNHLEEHRERAVKIRSRIGNYPLDPYNSVLLDNDRHTGELLFRLNPTGTPTFHNYGNSPPASVLDLGCGQGHWVVDAAIAWKGYGTKVIGYDMVDVSRSLLPWAAEHGVVDNIRFVRGNFLKQRLPFSDDSFDLVRMSCLALCVTSDSWVFVLQEVYRILKVGGRLEFIDDDIFFPYAKLLGENGSSTSRHPFPSDFTAPQLDVSIPSASFSTFNVIDSDFNNPGLGSVDDLLDSRLYGVDEVDEETDGGDEDDADDTEAETLIHEPSTSARKTDDPLKRGSRSKKPSQSQPNAQDLREIHHPGFSRQAWEESFATSRDLEALFDHMLVHKFGIQRDVNGFIFDLLQEVFGFAREMRTMHLTLAPSSTDPLVADRVRGGSGEEMRGRQPHYGGGSGSHVLSSTHGKAGMPQARGDGTTASATTPRCGSVAHRKSMGLGRTPGLVLWPSTFIPMDQHEIEIHASKHLRMLLSCKNLLMEHAIEATDDEQIDEDSVMEALWEYESFLRHRLVPPPPPSRDLAAEVKDEGDDAASLRGSIAESVSSDLWEIQNEFRQRFAWDRSRSRDRRNLTPVRGGASSSNSVTCASPVDEPRYERRRGGSVSSTAPPVYSQSDLTHVRTIRVFEAIKLDETLYQASI